MYCTSLSETFGKDIQTSSSVCTSQINKNDLNFTSDADAPHHGLVAAPMARCYRNVWVAWLAGTLWHVCFHQFQLFTIPFALRELLNALVLQVSCQILPGCSALKAFYQISRSFINGRSPSSPSTSWPQSTAWLNGPFQLNLACKF